MHKNKMISELRVNSERLKNDFDSLSEIGKTKAGGVHRPAFSEAHLEARSWFKKGIDEAELTFHIDPAGNHSALLTNGSRNSRTILIGSHLDSVPNGGRFDGALGIISALEVLRVVEESGISLEVNLEAIDFTDSEGSLIYLLGSSAIAGKLPSSKLENPRSGREKLMSVLDYTGISFERLGKAKRDPNSLAGYLELHIEQGDQVVDANAKIGIASAIVGYCSYNVSFIGRAEPSISTSMQERRDASLGASSFVLAVREIVTKGFPGCIANVSNLNFLPGAIDIIPGQVDVSLDFWATESKMLQSLETELLNRAHREAKRYGLGVDITLISTHKPEQFNSSIQKAITKATNNLNLDHIPVISMAGHNGLVLADICPAGMIFVPSVRGISHSPQEISNWDDCINGANVLLHSVLHYANGIND